MSGRVHLIGIAGSGVSALARWYRHLGWEVSGCDAHPGSTGAELAEEGIEVTEGHDPSHVDDCQLVVYTAAVPLEHPEIVAARSAGTRTLRKSEALAELSEGRTLVTVAGAHGKTTTCGMIGWALEGIGGNPTVFVGGKVLGWNSNFRAGGDPVIMEADEYDRAFLRVRPTVAVVTSFTSEHLECYGDEEALAQAYGIYLEQTLPGGSVVVPYENRDLALWARRIGRNVLTTGEGGDFHFRHSRKEEGWGALFESNIGLAGSLSVPGRHNVLNATSACAALTQLGYDPEATADALATFPGVSRRLERLGELQGKTIISDYAHHPEEIEASLRAVRESCTGPLGVFFEPHLYSRTARLSRDMGSALLLADWAMILPVYPAREEPIEGVTNDLVCSAIREMGGDSQTVTPELVSKSLFEREAGTVVFMGAGSVDRLARETLEGGK
jgi:UDP-N-acetylmuramate--alanine ligase